MKQQNRSRSISVERLSNNENVIPVNKKSRRSPKKYTYIPDVQGDSMIYESLRTIPYGHEIYRIGVIPYTKKEGKFSFLVGIDLKFGELTDFGGYKKDREKIEITAMRELYEETCELIDYRDKLFEITNSPVVVNKDFCVIFLNVTGLNYENITTDFSQKIEELTKMNFSVIKCKRYKYNAGVLMENSLIYWIDHDELSQLLQKRTRAINPRAYHESSVEVVNVDFYTKGVLNNIYNFSKKKRNTDSVFLSQTSPVSAQKLKHPFVYEKVRLELFNVWEKLLTIL